MLFRSMGGGRVAEEFPEFGRAVFRAVSHKLDEVIRLAHRVTVLRRGKVVAELGAEGLSRKSLGMAMLGLAAGNGALALAGAIGSAILSSATGPVENILIARYTPSRYHGLGFGAKFVVAFGASPLAIMAIAWVRKETGSLDLLFASLAGLSAVIAIVAD